LDGNDTNESDMTADTYKTLVC